MVAISIPALGYFRFSLIQFVYISYIRIRQIHKLQQLKGLSILRTLVMLIDLEALHGTIYMELTLS